MVKLVVFFAWVLMHPVHVTLTSIDFAPDQGGYNVFVRMYFDDFLADSRLNGNTLKEDDFTAGTSASREAVENYLNRKLIIRANEQILSGKIKELQVIDNEISTNLKYPGGKRPDSIIVKNLILTDLYGDMSNMVIVKVDDYEEGIKLTSDVTEQTFKIKRTGP